MPAERWLQFSWPPRWHYDVLRALDHFRRSPVPPTRGSPRPCSWSETSAKSTAPGCSRTPTQVRPSSSSRRATDARAGGTRCGRCASSTGTTADVDPITVRRWSTSGVDELRRGNGDRMPRGPQRDQHTHDQHQPADELLAGRPLVEQGPRRRHRYHQQHPRHHRRGRVAGEQRGEDAVADERGEPGRVQRGQPRLPGEGRQRGGHGRRTVQQ